MKSEAGAATGLLDRLFSSDRLSRHGCSELTLAHQLFLKFRNRHSDNPLNAAELVGT
jgi:hypothetical protein